MDGDLASGNSRPGGGRHRFYARSVGLWMVTRSGQSAIQSITSWKFLCPLGWAVDGDPIAVIILDPEGYRFYARSVGLWMVTGRRVLLHAARQPSFYARSVGLWMVTSRS